MRLSSKHANQQVVEITDFSGGLNTSTTEEQIQDNQLAECVNFELQAITGLLKTVDGTTAVYRKTDDASYQFESCAYDKMNDHVVLFADNGTIFSAKLNNVCDMRQIGRLSCNGEPICTTWEDGLLVASGGHLQYLAGFQAKTIMASPTKCKGTFSRAGRVLVFDDMQITFSAVGDEEGWTEDTNSDSSSKWIQPSYKQGGHILGLINMSSDMLIIMDNGLLLRLVGEYPDWQVKEIARNIDCRSPYAFCCVLNTAYILGQQSIYAINTTQEYGDLKAGNIASSVQNDLLGLPAGTKMRFIPSLYQIWLISKTKDVLILDVRVGSFYRRMFNAPVMDAVDVDGSVYVLKADGLDIIDSNSYTDEGKNLEYKLKTKTKISHYNYFVKRIVWACTGYTNGMHDVVMSLNNVINTPCPVQNGADGEMVVFGNWLKIYGNKGLVALQKKRNVVYDSSAKIMYDCFELVYNNPTPLVTLNAYAIYDQKVRLRAKALKLTVTGQGCKFVINKMKYDIVEV